MSGYLDENIEMFASNNTDPFDEDFEESNKMHGNQCIWQGVFSITSLSAFHFTTHCRSHILSSISGVSSVFSYSSLYCSVQMLFYFSCKWTYVWEPRRTGDVCRGQSYLVHLWARYRGGHPWSFFRGEHLQEAEHNTRHSQPVPSHHCCCRHAAKHSWLVKFHTHMHSQTHSADPQNPHPFL